MNEATPSQDGASKPPSGFRSWHKVIRNALIKMSSKRDNMNAFYKLSEKELRNIGYERGMLRGISNGLSRRPRS